MQIVRNKTLKYLYPCLIEYGPDFVAKINYFTKVFIGIGDVKHPTFDVNNPYLYLMFQVEEQTFFPFFEFLKEVRQQQFYIDDYTYQSDIRYSSHIVVVVKVPPQYIETYHKFRKGQYSEMYEETDIERLYAGNDTLETKVLKRDASLSVHLKNRIIEEYGLDEPVSFDSEIKEYELPPRLDEEVLNSLKNTLKIQKLLKI